MKIRRPTKTAAVDADHTVKHRHIDIDGIDVFYREAGSEDAPVVLLPHGYPCSSFQFRNFMPALADHWHLVAPDFPGFGYSDTPDGYTNFLDRFANALSLSRHALYLHDYGSQIGLRLAIKRPERIAALIIQNGDIYEDELGPKIHLSHRVLREPECEGPSEAHGSSERRGFSRRVPQ
jgi:pimeloyl-ACP methyl ester carboxylesterase